MSAGRYSDVGAVCQEIEREVRERSSFHDYRWDGHCRRLNVAISHEMQDLGVNYNPETDARVIWAREVLRLALKARSWRVVPDLDVQARAGFLLGWMDREPVGAERGCGRSEKENKIIFSEGRTMNMRESEWQMEALDRKILREMDRMTSGATAHHHVMQPDELAMAHEEEDEMGGRDALREEIFAGVCDWTMGAGLHPLRVRERMASVMGRFAPEVAMGMRGAYVWWDEAEVQKVLSNLQGRVAEPCFSWLFELSGKIRDEKDQRFVYQSFNGMCRFWVMEGMEWKKAVAAHMVIMKALRPQLIGQMSLEEIAVLCGDKGKATVSARGKRLFNARLEAMGMRGTHAHYQKSPEAVEKYRKAQMGNSNRRK